MHLGRKVKLDRIKRGLKQRDLAAMIGVTQNYLSLIECGRVPLPKNLEERIYRALEKFPVLVK